MAKKKKSPAAALIDTPDGLAAAVNRYVAVSLTMEELKAAHERRVASINQEFELATVDLVAEIESLSNGAHLFCEQHRDLFPEGAKSIAYRNAVVGFRNNPPKVDKVIAKDTWDAIAKRMAGLAWAVDYIRDGEPSVDKDAILAHRADLPEAMLKKVGIVITQGETFFINPTGDAAPSLAVAA